MTQLQQPQGSDEGQQCAIGQSTRVINRGRFAAEGHGQGLRGLGAGQMEGGVPDAGHRAQ